MTQDKPEPTVPDAELDFDDELVYRWRGELFTGVGYEDRPGRGRSEVSYRYGVQEGPARDWYPSGALKGESFFRENVQHGVMREYDESGALVRESLYEYGILVEEKERNSQGEMTANLVLSLGDDKYELLERYRREKGWPLTLLPLLHHKHLCRRGHSPAERWSGGDLPWRAIYTPYS